MREKYLFFDMDRTLVSHTTRKIPDSTIEAIRLASKNGHRCFICTGRNLKMAQEYEDVVDIPGVVFSNGGGIAYEGKVLETRDIAKKDVEAIIDIVEKLHGGYSLLCAESSYQNPITRERFVKNFTKGYKNLPPEKVLELRGMYPIEEYSGENVQKIDINFVDELTADVCFSRIPQSLELIPAGGYFAGMGRTGAEITAESVTKGSGVKRVVDLFGADLYDTYAFGDSGNDISMLKMAHTGIAMGNGDEDAKKSADYITNDVDHDGIWNALKHFELI